MINPLVTQQQAENISSDYGINASGAAGVPQSQLALSYLSLDPRTINEYSQNSGNNNNDSTLQDLIKNGYLSWGNDVQGNQQLAAGGVLQDALNKQYATLSTGSPTNLGQIFNKQTDPFGQALKIPAATPGYIPQYQDPEWKAYHDMISKALSTGEVHSFNPGIQGNYTGDVDPITGLQKFNVTGLNPDITMNSKWTAMQGPLLSSLIMAPMAGVMAGGMAEGLGGLGSSLFSQVGQSAMNGGKFNFNPLSLLGVLGSNFNIPPEVMKYIQMASGLLKGGHINPTQLAMSQGPSLIKALMNNFGG